jgi:signal transduction histidine kinase
VFSPHTEVMTPEPQDAVRRRVDEHWNRRRELERQLHDGPALRIAALTLRLGLLAQTVRDDTGDLRIAIEDLQGRLHDVLEELRVIADRIYPPLLQEAGLGPALRELAGSAAVPIRVDAVDRRFGPSVEGAAYFAVLEGLADLRAATRTVDVTVRQEDDCLALDLANVNTGQAVAVRDRIQLIGGAVEVAGGAGIGTIKVRIPCE